ncbi:glycoside hydrolase family 105 protein [Pterulicium gracile]|uniref:Glycoside hydrolase family 105 protein n=1 Tax=Pterulicium gracile TaxID=1884261 RepID=A0A5C3Q6R0_9AGAR|nr:glycoside hydrolase family 105 protein [Pterula gracilis]
MLTLQLVSLAVALGGFLPQVALARPKSYGVWAADSIISRGQGHGLDNNNAPRVSYEHGEFQWALRLLYEKTGNKTYFDYIRTGVDNIVQEDGSVLAYTIPYASLDPLRAGPSFMYLYEKTGAAKYKKAADLFRSQLNVQPRTPEGQFWHRSTYPNQGWLDGIYMADVFYARYTLAYQPTNATAWADVAKQFHLQWAHTLQYPNATDAGITQLLYHGYDSERTAVWALPDRGRAPHIWLRAVGWYAMALVDTLELFPRSHPDYAKLLAYAKFMFPKIRDAADKGSGVWWHIMTEPGRAGNYFESSGAAMFVYASLKAVRLGYVSDADGSIVKGMKKAYGYATSNWVTPLANGTMDWEMTVNVGSLGSNGTYEYYIAQPIALNDLKGAAAFVLASLEYERL